MDPSEVVWKGAACAGGLTTHGVGSAGTLTVSAERLSIESGLGSFSFRPQDVVRIERSGLIPWFWAGIRVRHRVSSYPEDVGFCPRGTSSRRVLEVLQQHGYPVA